MIFGDVLKALEGGRLPLVLTERRDHLGILAQRFSLFTRYLVVLRGGLSKVEREAAYATLRQAGEQERLIVATGRYLGKASTTIVYAVSHDAEILEGYAMGDLGTCRHLEFTLARPDKRRGVN